MRHFILVTLLGMTSIVNAQGVSSVETSTLANEQRQQRFSLGLGTVNYRYEEPGVMKISGRMSQLAGEYRAYLPREAPMFVAIQASYTFSSSNTYDGALQNLETGAITPKSDGSRDAILEGRGLFDLVLIDGLAQSVDGFAGLGVWSLTNKVSGEGSYGRQATYVYLPVGLTYSARIDRLLLSMTGEYDLYLSGQTTSKMTDLGGSGDIVHQQDSGSGWRAKIGGEYKLDKFTLLAGVYYQAWNIAQSDSTGVLIRKSNGATAAGTVVEPANRTSMTGITLGARF